MPLRTYKPTSPGQRGTVLPDFSEITKKKPEKSLLAPLKKTGGRNNTGRITVRHRGGGHKRRYRIIDFKRSRDADATVEAIEYDPNRSARIALRTPQVIAHASGAAETIAPFAGSYFIESLTDEIEARAWELIGKVDELGGSVEALEFIQREIEEFMST